MIKENFSMAFRALGKHKFTSVINILGLSIGMGVCLAILQYIQFEKSYDKFHENVNNTYRLTLTMLKNDEVNRRQAQTSYGIGIRAKEEIPEIENFVRIHPEHLGAVITNPTQNSPFLEENILFADSTFFELFDFPLIKGNPSSALSGKYNIVITEKMSEKYFGRNADPIGQTLKFDGWVTNDFIVTGVLKSLPPNSHLNFDFLLSMRALLDSDSYNKGRGKWGRTNFFTYLTINENGDSENIQTKLDQLIHDNFGKTLDHHGITWKLKLQPITDIHLKSDHLEDLTANSGNMQEIKILGVISLIILIAAWLNFINLSIASSIKRAKDVGIRKALGAFKQQIRNQFIVESLLINIVSAVVSLFIAVGILAILNTVLESNFTMLLYQHLEFWMFFIIFIIVSTLISGFYPAFVLSSFTPVNIQKIYSFKSGIGLSLRKGLIIFQFLISALLISATYIIYQQITFMKSQDLGIDMEQVLVVRGPEIVSNDERLASDLESFKTESSRLSSILSATSSGTVPGKGHSAVLGMRRIGEEPTKNQPGGISYVDDKFFETYNFQFIAGKPFNDNTNSNNVNVIINEIAVKTYELVSPEKAIHKKIIIRNDTVNVVGVLKNFHWQSLKDAHMPILFVASDRAKRFFSFKINPSNISESLNHIRSQYNEVFAGNPFYYSFLDDEFNEHYNSDVQFGNIFLMFSLCAIFITCLGLFAFVSYSASQRTKEMGIRKVLGAEVKTLMIILSKEYIILLLIAILISVPFIIYGAKDWLSNFAFRINLEIGLFIIPAIILLTISFLTVSYRVFVSAKTNVVDSLRLE